VKLYRLTVQDEIRVAPDDQNLALTLAEETDIPSHDLADILRVEELAEPEATLHLTQTQIAALTRLVAGEMGREAVDQLRPNYKETLRKLKINLDGLTWQLAAQKTMLERAQ
jgi:hypothetical protein